MVAGARRAPVPIRASATSSSSWTASEIDGVVGYRISFARVPAPGPTPGASTAPTRPTSAGSSSRVTEKGLNRLQDWLNDATDDGTPTGKNVTIIARDNEDQLLAQWDFTGVNPVTFSSAAAGNVNEVDSTVEFAFDRMRLVEARARVDPGRVA